jgi:hypothetical protein
MLIFATLSIQVLKKKWDDGKKKNFEELLAKKTAELNEIKKKMEESNPSRFKVSFFPPQVHTES